ncbi:MAG: hypothetical protein K940chlam9_00157 [Chlamydiae bacterium]|nr:hypothetical protein [Chlamydiota bacterium]
MFRVVGDWISSVQSKKESSFLQKEGEKISAALKVMKALSSLPLTLEKGGEELLLTWGKELRKLDWHQFALMHDASIIHRTKYEGGELTATLQAWHHVFSQWREGDVGLLAKRLSKQQIEHVIKKLEQVYQFYQLRPEKVRESLSYEKCEKYAEAFLKGIREELKKGSPIYLPLGYRHGLGSYGHVIMTKIVPTKNGVLVYLLNQGSGSTLHPPITFTTTQERISYQFYPIFVSNEAFFGDLGLAAFGQLMRYLADPPSIELPGYWGTDIYDIFLTLGEVQLDAKEEWEKRTTNSKEDIWTCTAQAGKLVIRDLLVDMGLARVEMDLVFASARLLDLMAAFHAYRDDPQEEYRVLLRSAAEKFGLVFKKLEFHFSNQERLGAAALLHRIMEETTPPSLEKKVVESLPDPKNIVMRGLPNSFPLIEMKENKEALHANEQSAGLFDPLRIVKPEFAVETIERDLEKWVVVMEKLPNEKRLAYLYDCTQVLPIPEYEVGDVWSRFSTQKGTGVMAHLQTLLSLGIGGQSVSNFSDYFTMTYFSIHTIYTIVDALARKNPHAKLDRFCPPYQLYLEDVVYGDFLHIPLAKQNRRYEAIRLYFANVSQGRFPIFPVQELLSVEQYFEDLRYGGKNNCTTNHADYLQQHRLNGGGSHLALWVNQEWAFYPAEVSTLYYVATLSHTLLYRWEQFPKELLFESALDVRGKPALKMKLGELRSKEELIWEDGFCQMGEKVLQSRSGCFVREFFFSREIATWHVNDAVVVRIPEEHQSDWHLTEPLIRDLLRITRKRNLQVYLGAEWMKSHPIYLDNGNVRLVLEHCLFAPGLLAMAIENEPTFPLHLRKIIADSLGFYRSNPSHYKTILFLLRVGVSLETFFSEQGGQAEALSFYGQELQTLSQKIEEEEPKEVVLAELFFHKLFLDLHKESHSREEIEDLVFCSFQMQAHVKRFSYDEKAPWIVDEIPALYRDFLYANREACSDQETILSVCSRILCHFFKEEEENQNFSGEFPYFTNGKIWIDLLHQQIHDPSKGFLTFPSELSPHRIASLLEQHGGEGSIWQKDGVYRSKDGKVLFNSDLSIIEKEIVFRGDARWSSLYNFSSTKIDPLGCGFLEHWGKLDWIHFTLREKKEGDPDILTFEKGAKFPFLRIDYREDEVEMTKLDEGGESLPIQLVHMQNIAKEHKELHKIANLFAEPGEVVCFVNTQTGVIEELNFYLHDLHFVRKKEGLACRQHPGFYLLTGHTLEELNHYSAVLVLSDGNGEGRVFIPGFDLQVSSDPFSREVFPKVEKNNTKIFSYELDPRDGSLLSPSCAANFYLAYLLKRQRDYEKALRYASKALRLPESKREAFFWVSYFRAIEDPSPASFAFNLQILLKVIEQRSLLQEEELQEAETVPYMEKELISWTVQVFSGYLRMLSREDLSSIPRGLRLSKGEEKLILFYLKRKKKELPQLLQIRLDLLTRKGGEMTISIGEREVLLRPKKLMKLFSIEELSCSLSDYADSSEETKERETDVYDPIAPNSIRFAPKEVVKNFPRLYELARKVPHDRKDPFDFTLLALLSTPYSQFGWGKELSHLLFYVRHLSLLFTDLPLDEEVPLEGQKACLQKIIKTLSSWAKENDSADILEQITNSKGVFPYTADILINYPEPPHPHPIPREQKEAIDFSSPFTVIGVKLFKKESRPLTYQPFSMDKRKGVLENEQISLFEEGFHQLGGKEEVSYTLKSQNLQGTKKNLKTERKALNKELRKRRKKIHSVLNGPYQAGKGAFAEKQLQDQVEFLFALESRQAEMLLPEKVMKEGILKNDLNFWKDHRPHLTEQEVLAVVEDVKSYYHLLVLYEMAKEGHLLTKELLNDPEQPEKAHSLATLLHYEFSYDPSLYPEIAYMKIKTGKLPRKEQIEIYLWVCEGMERGENRLFQLHAGGGKTSFLTPLLMLRARMFGYLPAFGSTQAIYSVDKENLGKQIGELGFKLTYLEVGMHMKLKAKDLQHIFNQLRIYRDQGDGLILTPQIVYTLHLLYRFAALKEQDLEKVKWASLILAFFKKRVFLLLDESHRNLDALTRAIYGVGEKEYLPEKEQELFLALMKPLLGLERVVCGDKREVADVLNMKENSQGLPPKADLLLVRKTLARHMLNSPLLEIPHNEREAHLAYWTEKRGEIPSSLVQLGKSAHEKADLIALTRYFLQDLLSQVIESRTELDHAPSIYPDEEFDTPRHHKIPSTAQFEDSYRTLALSIKGTYHRGLSLVQVTKLLIKLLESDRREQEQVPEREITSFGEKFRSWVKGTSFAGQELRDLNLSHFSQTEELIKVLKKHPSVIEEYLLKFILPDIASSDAQLYVTPVHLLHTFAQSVSFSATPYLSAVYPRLIKSFKYDPTFEAHVVAEFSLEKNQTYLFPSTAEPASFFAWLEGEQSVIFEETTILNDPGGFFCDYPNEEVAKAWLSSNPKLDGVVYFKEARSLSVDTKQTISLLLRGAKEVIEIQGSDLKRELEKRDLKWESIRLGSYYDAAHTESTDIPQKADAKMLLFGGDSLTYSHLIQALMRARGFLDPKQDQTVCWVFHVDLAVTIHPEKELSGAKIFVWTQKNEVREMKKRVILAAYQEISFQIEALAMEEIQAALTEPEQQIALMKKYAGGLLEKIPHDPFGRYGEPTTYEQTVKVLTHFAKRFYKRFGYPIAYEKNQELKSKVREICEQTAKILERIPTQINKKISSQIEQQESKIKRMTEKQEYRPRPFDPLSIEGVYGNFGIENPNYPEWSRQLQTSRVIFKSKGLTEHLHFEENQLRTAKESGVALNEKLLKPIDFFLIIHHDGKRWAVAVTNEIQATHIDTLRKTIQNGRISHSAFLVTSEGTLVQKGTGSLAPPNGLVQEVLGSQWFQDLIIDAALLRGQVRHPDRLLERLKTWDHFPDFWNRIVEAQPNPETANQYAITRLLPKN